MKHGINSATIGFINLLKAEGGSVSVRNAAKLYGGSTGCSEATVRKAARARRLIAIRDGNGELLFPVWQFAPRGGTLPGLREVLMILSHRPHADALTPVAFFINPTSRLTGLSPIEALRLGRENLVSVVKQLALEAAE